MIWDAVKFITLSEIIGWIAFLAVALVLGAFGIREEGAWRVVLYAVWIVLFFGAYQLLNRRRRARRS